MANSNLAAQERAFFGNRWYDLPGNANERAQGEERYDSIRAGYDPAFNRLVGTVTVTYASGAVETKKNPTLDEYQRLETAYLADSGYSDLETNTVTVYGGAEYFVSPQNTNELKINHAFGDASTAISQKKGKKKDPCKDFFTNGRSLEEVSALFRSFWKSAFHDHQWGGNAGTRNAGGDPMAATVRVGSAFFADDDRTPGTGLSWSAVNNMYLTTLTNLTPRQNRAATILHEFAHALGLIPSDRENPAQSARNDAIIFEKCGTILDALPLKD